MTSPGSPRPEARTRSAKLYLPTMSPLPQTDSVFRRWISPVRRDAAVNLAAGIVMQALVVVSGVLAARWHRSAALQDTLDTLDEAR